MVAYTEYAARAAAFLLSEVYDSLLLWFAPQALIALIRSLDLTFVLGNEQNVEELRGLLKVIEDTDFKLHAPAQSLRFSHDRARHLSYAEPIHADFVYYHLWEGCVLQRHEYLELRSKGRIQKPAGHPTGLDWGEEVEGWDGRRYVRPADVGDAGDAESPAKVDFFGPDRVRQGSTLWLKNAVLTTYPSPGARFGVSTVDTTLPEGQRSGYVLGSTPSGAAPAGPPSPAPVAGVVGPADGAVAIGASVDAAGVAPVVEGQTYEQTQAAVRWFLRRVGFNENHLTSLDNMTTYTQGRCGL